MPVGRSPPAGQLNSPPSRPAALRSFGEPRRSPGGRRRSPGAAAPARAPAGPPSSGLGRRGIEHFSLGRSRPRAGGAASSALTLAPHPRPPSSSQPLGPGPTLGPARGSHHGWPGAPPAGGRGLPPPAAARCSGPWPWPCTALQREREGQEAEPLRLGRRGPLPVPTLGRSIRGLTAKLAVHAHAAAAAQESGLPALPRRPAPRPAQAQSRRSEAGLSASARAEGLGKSLPATRGILGAVVRLARGRKRGGRRFPPGALGAAPQRPLGVGVPGLPRVLTSHHVTRSQVRLFLASAAPPCDRR